MGKYAGKVYYPFVLFKNEKGDVSDRLKRHELEHVYQIKRKGVIRWYLSYLVEWLKKGYRENKYETEADRVANQPLTEKEKALFDGPNAKDSRFWVYVGVCSVVVAITIIASGYFN